MNTKRSLVVLFAVAVTVFLIPSMAFATETLPETIDAKEQMSFEPLLYATIMLATVALCSVVVSLVFVAKYRAQKELICHTYTCHNNPQYYVVDEDGFDYRLIETPAEFTGSSHAQSDYVAQALGRHVAEEIPPEAQALDRHVVEEIPPVAQAHEYLAAATEITQEIPLVKSAYVGKHSRGAQKSVSSALLQNPQVPSKDSGPRMVLLSNHKKTLTPPQKAVVHEVPIELEQLLRKIS